MTTTDRNEAAAGGHQPPLSKAQAAEFLNVSDRWMTRAVQERRIPYLKVGRHVRFLVEDLIAFLDAARIDPVSGEPGHDFEGRRVQAGRNGGPGAGLSAPRDGIRPSGVAGPPRKSDPPRRSVTRPGQPRPGGVT